MAYSTPRLMTSYSGYHSLGTFIVGNESKFTKVMHSRRLLCDWGSLIAYMTKQARSSVEEILITYE